MKLGDLKPGKEFAAVDATSSRHVSKKPRRVEVVEIVEVPSTRYDALTETYLPAKTRKVVVKFLDDPAPKASTWAPFESAKKGSVMTVEPRSVLAKWSEVGPKLRKEHEQEQATAALQVVLDKRLKKLGLHNDFCVRATGPNTANLGHYGSSLKSIDKLLSLAEKGKGIS